MKAYKGMDKNMRCRGFQFEVGKTYEEPEAVLCKKGFHACTEPLDVFQYYTPANSRFFEVELDGVAGQRDNDSKVAAKMITIVRELTVDDIIDAQQRLKQSTTGGYGSALTGGNKSALTGGYGSALTGGDWSALTGGYKSALRGGDRSALTGGDWSALTGGDKSALTGGDGSALRGGDGSALTGGDWSALTGGDKSALTGGYKSALRGGYGAKVRGGMWSVLALERWVDGDFDGVACGVVDGVTLKADTWYTLKNGEFVEVAADE